MIAGWISRDDERKLRNQAGMERNNNCDTLKLFMKRKSKRQIKARIQ